MCFNKGQTYIPHSMFYIYPICHMIPVLYAPDSTFHILSVVQYDWDLIFHS